MSITPMPAASTAAPATPTGEPGTDGRPDGPADGTFAALVSSLLGAGLATSTGTAAADPAVVPPLPVEAEVVEPAAAEGTPAEGDVEVLPSVASPLWSALATQLVPAPAPVAPGAAPAEGSVEQTTPQAVGAVADGGGDPLAAVGATTQTTSTSPASPAPAATAADPATARQSEVPGTIPGTDPGAPAEGGSTASTAEGADAAAQTSADTSQGETGDQPPAAPAPARAAENEAVPAPASSGIAPGSQTSAATPTAAMTPTTSTDAPRPVAVVSQLAPEVTRLVSAGNGLHRVTMLLQPEALGEVRVTLTVRNGEVVVRLAAGDDAQRALLEGAPELRRVLELAGASDARVVVRDLPSATPGSQQGWQSPERSAHPDSSGAFGSGGDTHASGHGRGDDQDQHARTRGGSTARDGLTDGAHQLRPNPVTDASPGIDLTM